MNGSIPLYEGDSLLHNPVGAQPLEVAGECAQPLEWLTTALATAVHAIDRWVVETAERDRQRRIERYMDGAQDLAEVERRVRELENPKLNF